MNSSGSNYSTIFLVVVGLLWGGGLCLPGNNPSLQLAGPLVFIAVSLFTPNFHFKMFQDFTITYAAFCMIALIPACLRSLIDGKLLAYLLLLPVIISYSALPKESRRALSLSLSYSGLIFGLVSLLQFGISSELIYDGSVRLGGIKNPNAIAYIVGISAIFIGCFSGNMMQKACVFILALVPILATKSKTGLALILIGYLLILLQNQKSKKAVIFLCSFILLASFYIFSTYLNGIKSFFELDTDRTLSDGTGRLDGWIYLLNRFSSSDVLSILFGQGAGSSTDAVQALNSSAHNSWIMILFDFGIIGILLQLSLITQAFIRRTYYLLAPVIVAGLIESLSEVNYIGVGNVGSILFVFAMYELSATQMDSQTTKLDTL